MSTQKSIQRVWSKWPVAILVVTFVSISADVIVPSRGSAQVEVVSSADSGTFQLPVHPSNLPPDLITSGHLQALLPLSPGSLCPSGAQCIVGGGFGVNAEIERRWPSGWGLTLGYGMTFLDGGGLYEVGVLQTIHAGARYTFLPSNRVHPFVGARGFGLGFGESFQVETTGFGAEVRGGMQWEMTAAVSLIVVSGASLHLISGYTTAGDSVVRGQGLTAVPALSLSVGLSIAQLD